MTPQHVVVLGEKSGRRRSVRIRAWSVGQVQQLPIILIDEDTEPRPELFDHRGQSGYPRPDPDI
jgi:hypothetical protein